jgi:hypothetical protein
MPIRRAAAELQYCVENVWNFEYRPVLNARDARTVFIDPRGQCADAGTNGPE